jgi:hypothetical protein
VGLKSWWIQRIEEKSFVSGGDWTPVVQSIVRHIFHSDLKNSKRDKAILISVSKSLLGGGGGLNS